MLTRFARSLCSRLEYKALARPRGPKDPCGASSDLRTRSQDSRPLAPFWPIFGPSGQKGKNPDSPEPSASQKASPKLRFGLATGFACRILKPSASSFEVFCDRLRLSHLLALRAKRLDFWPSAKSLCDRLRLSHNWRGVGCFAPRPPRGRPQFIKAWKAFQCRIAAFGCEKYFFLRKKYFGFFRSQKPRLTRA